VPLRRVAIVPLEEGPIVRISRLFPAEGDGLTGWPLWEWMTSRIEINVALTLPLSIRRLDVQDDPALVPLGRDSDPARKNELLAQARRGIPKTDFTR